MAFHRCCDCEFHQFDDTINSLQCLQGNTPYFIIPKRLFDFLVCGWVANCGDYLEITPETRELRKLIDIKRT